MERWSNLAVRCLCTLLLMAAQYHCFDGYGYGDDDEGTLRVVNLNSSSELMEYSYAEANYGPSLPSDDYFKGIVHTADPLHACSPLKPPPFNVKIPSDHGWLAVVERSDSHNPRIPSCTFIEKTMNAQKAGYSGIIVYNFMGSSPSLIPMGTDNATAANQVVIHAVFVDFETGVDLKSISYPERDVDLWLVEFKPNSIFEFDPYKILIPLAFSFVGVLLVTCIVMVVRWCQAIRKRQRSRMSRSQLKKIPIRKYKLGDKYDCCTICLDDYAVGEKLRILPCEHTYHQKCIDPWLLKNKKTCPVCKRRVIPRKNGQPADSESESEDERQPLIVNSPTTSGAESDVQPRGSYGATQGAQGGARIRVPARNPFASSDDSSDDEQRIERRRLFMPPSLTVPVQSEVDCEAGPEGLDENDDDPLLLNSARIALQNSMTSHDDFQAHSLHSIHNSAHTNITNVEPNISQAYQNNGFQSGEPKLEASNPLSETGSVEIETDSEMEADLRGVCEVRSVNETSGNVVV